MVGHKGRRGEETILDREKDGKESKRKKKDRLIRKPLFVCLLTSIC